MLGISWLEPPASRCCTALHTDNSLPDRSNSTRFGWRKADFNRSSHNLDKSPTTDNHSTSTPVRERPTTSRSAAMPAMVPAALVPAREAVAQAREAAVKAAPMERAGVESAAAEASTVETPPPPCPPPPCAAWARSGSQGTAAPSYAAAMLTTRRLLPGGPLLLRNSRIE